MYASDLPLIAEASGLALLPEVDANRLATKMNQGLLAAHTAQLVAQRSPRPGATRSAFNKVGEKGRELLSALGFADEEMAGIAVMGLAEIAKASGVINALFRRHLDSDAKIALPLVLQQRWPEYQAGSEEAISEFRRYVIESVRGLAFLVAFAHETEPAESKSGPAPDMFRRVLLDHLVCVHHEAFGYFPVLRADRSEERGGPSLNWLRQILRVLNERRLALSLTDRDAFHVALDRMMEASIQTLGSDLEYAISRIEKERKTAHQHGVSPE